MFILSSLLSLAVITGAVAEKKQPSRGNSNVRSRCRLYFLAILLGSLHALFAAL